MSEASGPSLRAGRSPLAGLRAESIVAAGGALRAILIVERPLATAIQVSARRGASARVAAAIKSALAVMPPDTPRMQRGEGVDALWSGPDQWMIMADAGRAAVVETMLREAALGLASIVDQSHSRVQIGLSGARVRDVLAKLVTIDLYPSMFAEHDAAMTVLAHIPVQIWRGRDADGVSVFEIAGPQSYAQSLWHHVVVAAAEYGVDAKPATG